MQYVLYWYCIISMYTTSSIPCCSGFHMLLYLFVNVSGSVLLTSWKDHPRIEHKWCWHLPKHVWVQTFQHSTPTLVVFVGRGGLSSFGWYPLYSFVVPLFWLTSICSTFKKDALRFWHQLSKRLMFSTFSPGIASTLHKTNSAKNQVAVLRCLYT